MPAIEVSGLTKTFRTYKKQPGFAGALRGLVRRTYEQTVAVRDVSFQIEPGELVARLSDALGSVFKALNEIVGAIHGELGAAPGGNETIRGIVGAAVQGLEGAPTVEEYIGAIKKAFLAAAAASREAAKALAGFIMAELDPAAMDAAKGGLAIGPLKKAQAFEAYEDAYARVRRWFESDRFMLDFQRQFEKNCLRFLEHHGG